MTINYNGSSKVIKRLCEAVNSISGSVLPEVTAADNGKALRVHEGAWAVRGLDDLVKRFTVTAAPSVWRSLSGHQQWFYYTEVTITGYTVGENTVVELVNDNISGFLDYGFSIAAVSGQTVTLYAFDQPETSETFTFLLYEAA